MTGQLGCCRRITSSRLRGDSTADEHAVPAGGALAVDRGRYSAALTEALDRHPLVTIERREQHQLPDPSTISVLATGPLTSEDLAEDLRSFTGTADCHFFDAASPIVHGDTSALRSHSEPAVTTKAMRTTSIADGSGSVPPIPRRSSSAEQAELKDFDRDDATFFEDVSRLKNWRDGAKTRCVTARSNRSASGSPLRT